MRESSDFKQVAFTVILPLHNDAAILEKNFRLVVSSLSMLGLKHEIILAEDGSDDGTKKIAEKFVSKNVRLLSSSTRLGRGRAISNAIREAKGDIIAYMDVDLATDLSYLPGLVGEVERGADIATGSRLLPGSKVVGRSFAREISSRVYNLLLRMLFRTRIHDHQCGFKAFRRSSVLPLLDKVGDSHWFWDSELLILSQKNRLGVAELPVVWTDSKDSHVSLKSDILSMGSSMLRLRFRI